MPFSLINDAWLPVLRQHSGSTNIRPAQITENIETDPVVAIAWPRADFRLATLEFLIGLLATACPPTGRRHWPEWYLSPPAAAVLDAAFAPLAFAFELDGNGPRFMQDFEDLAAAPNDIANLLIEAPGDQTIKKNADLLNKRGQVKTLSRAAAAMALFTLQTYAPSGGSGNMTGLRGGGPLTTLVLPPAEGTLPLWRLLWVNVPVGEPVKSDQYKIIFPWLRKTTVSKITSKDTKKTIVSDQANLQLVYWAMPRRIRLNFSPAEDGNSCDLTGLADSVLVKTWRQQKYGEQYDRFIHPLTPYYKKSPSSNDRLPMHAPSGKVGYKDFVGLVFAPPAPSATEQPALTIITFRENRLETVQDVPDAPWRLIAAGYAMDKMKSRGFVETEFPIYDTGDTNLQKSHDQTTRYLVHGAKAVVYILCRAIRRAMLGKRSKASLTSVDFASVVERFWFETEPGFSAAIALSAAGTEPASILNQNLHSLRKTAIRLFDDSVPIEGTSRPERVAAANKWLGLSLHGYGFAGKELFNAFGLEMPQAAKQRKGRRK